MGLSVLTERSGNGVAVVRAAGEIDLASAEVLGQETAAALAHAEITEVVVDLSGVTFMDSSGIGMLVKQRRLADESGKLFRVSGVGGMVRNVLHITGLWQHLRVQEV